MDRAVYSDPLLSEVAEGVAMVRVDVDQPAGKALAARFGILQYPTLVHLSPEGKETLRWVGPLTLRDTRLNLGQAAVPSSRRKEVEAAVEKRPADSGTIASAILFYGCRGEVENARRLETDFRVPAIDQPPARAHPVVLALAKAEEFAGREARALEPTAAHSRSTPRASSPGARGSASRSARNIRAKSTTPCPRRRRRSRAVPKHAGARGARRPSAIETPHARFLRPPGIED
jgi:hypothetical protein